MKILLKVTRAQERLVWQKRLSDLKRHLPFELRVVSGIDGTVQRADRLVWVLETEDWDEELERLLQGSHAMKSQLGEGGLLVLVISRALEEQLSPQKQETLFNVCAQIGDEWLREMAWSESALYLRLFKPRTKAQRMASVSEKFDGKPVLPPTALAETTLLDAACSETDLDGETDLSRGPDLSTSANQNRKSNEGKPRFSGLIHLPWKRKKADVSGERLRMKLCISGHSALAYEMAAALAEFPDRQVLLMDLDRFAPSADLYAGVKPFVNQPYDFFTKVSATGLNILLDCGKKGQVHREAFLKCSQTVKGFSNLHVLTGVYQLGDYEYYKSEDLASLVDLAAGYYDVIVLKTNCYPYDGFTLMAMAKSDYILTGLKPSVEEVRAHKQLTDLLWEKQNISRERQGWVAFESGQADALERRFLTSLNEEGFIGWVPELEARLRCERTGSSYLKQSRERLEEIYQPMIARIGERLVSA